MNIKIVISTINQMVADGLIERYAIGGAVGATFYLEPVATLDVDIFVAFALEAGKLPISLQPLFDYLASRGYAMEGEYVIIAGTPVQFLPPTGTLVEESLQFAVVHDLDGTPARAFTAEHLAAIALETGRAKDKTRLLQFLEEGALGAEVFQQILARHGLAERWGRFERQFLHDQP